MNMFRKMLILFFVIASTLSVFAQETSPPTPPELANSHGPSSGSPPPSEPPTTGKSVLDKARDVIEGVVKRVTNLPDRVKEIVHDLKANRTQ